MRLTPAFRLFISLTLWRDLRGTACGGSMRPQLHNIGPGQRIRVGDRCPAAVALKVQVPQQRSFGTQLPVRSIRATATSETTRRQLRGTPPTTSAMKA